MEMMVGKFMLEKVENANAMMKVMNISEEMMKTMTGAPGMMMETMMSGDKMTMKRNDGMNTTFMMGKEFDMPMGKMMMKVMPKMEGKMLTMMITMPDGMMAERKYKFDSTSMTMDMSCNGTMMKMMYKRM